MKRSDWTDADGWAIYDGDWIGVPHQEPHKVTYRSSMGGFVLLKNGRFQESLSHYLLTHPDALVIQQGGDECIWTKWEEEQK